jgi:BCD family chlorophyll transporter-like MFS transporter
MGVALGVPGFAAIILSATGGGVLMFLAGTFATGVGTGLFGHATLTATMRAAPRDNIGLALGAWGSVQATAAGVGMALAGWVRDVIVAMPPEGGLSVQTPYLTVFSIEMVFLAVAVIVIFPLAVRGRLSGSPHPRTTSQSNPVEAP